MTNAHVVAGQDDTVVVRPDGTRLAATTVAFDPDRDLALLSVPGLGQPPLTIADGQVGTTVAVFGHPRGQARSRCRRPRSASRSGPSGGASTGSAWFAAPSTCWPPSWLRVTRAGDWSTRTARWSASPSPSPPTATTTAYALTAEELRPLLPGASRGRGRHRPLPRLTGYGRRGGTDHRRGVAGAADARAVPGAAGQGHRAARSPGSTSTPRTTGCTAAPAAGRPCSAPTPSSSRGRAGPASPSRPWPTPSSSTRTDLRHAPHRGHLPGLRRPPGPRLRRRPRPHRPALLHQLLLPRPGPGPHAA